MAGFLEYILAASGALCTTFIISWIVVPLLYGVPLVIWWTARRYLKWRTPLIYAAKPIFYGIVFCGGATMLLSFFTRPTIALVTNFWFANGILIGAILWLGRIIIFKSIRSEIHYRLTESIKPHVTPKGRIALLALVSRW